MTFGVVIAFPPMATADGQASAATGAIADRTTAAPLASASVSVAGAAGFALTISLPPGASARGGATVASTLPVATTSPPGAIAMVITAGGQKVPIERTFAEGKRPDRVIDHVDPSVIFDGTSANYARDATRRFSGERVKLFVGSGRKRF